MSSVVNPARPGPGISPRGVTCTRVSASPEPAAASAAAAASAYAATGSVPARSAGGRLPGAIGYRGAWSPNSASASHRVPITWFSTARTSHSVHGVAASSWPAGAALTISAVEATAPSNAGNSSIRGSSPEDRAWHQALQQSICTTSYLANDLVVLRLAVAPDGPPEGRR